MRVNDVVYLTESSAPVSGALFKDDAGQVFVYTTTFGWVSAENATPVESEFQDGVTNSWLDKKGATPEPTADTPTTDDKRIENGTKASLYGKNYIYNSAQNRWIEPSTEKPALGLAHRKLMKQFNADDYGRVKSLGLFKQAKKSFSQKLGLDKMQGTDPNAGFIQRAAGKVGHTIGYAIGNALTPKQPQAAESIDLSRLRILSGIDKNENL